MRKPEILNRDAYGEAWMLIVRATSPDWMTKLVTGEALGPALEEWFGKEAYRGR